MRRRVALFFGFGLLLPLVVAAGASAQGSSLRLSQQTAKPGDVLTATGSGYQPMAASDVTIRLSTRNGRVLRTTPPDPEFNISTTFPLPQLSPGWYLVLAIQTTNANGRARAFTPGRTRLLVTAAEGGSAVPAGGRGGASEPVPVPVPVLLLGAGALAAGAGLALRRVRTANRPQLGS